MATPYYTKQPVYLKDPSGRFSNILKSTEPLVGAAAKQAMTSTRNQTVLNFPFTPTISVIQSANYNQYDFDHSNFQQRTFVSHSNKIGRASCRERV